jgi:methyl-accepting chemotaxis protein
MSNTWTFARKIAIGFALVVTLAVAVAGVSFYALRDVVASKDRVIAVDAQLLIDAAQLDSATQRAASARFLLTGDERFLEEIEEARTESTVIVDRLKQQIRDDKGRELFDIVDRARNEHNAAVDQVVAERRRTTDLELINRRYEEHMVPRREALAKAMDAFVAHEKSLLDAATQASSDAASRAIVLVVVIALLAVFFACAVAFFLARTLNSQIGTAVGQVQSSSTELQAAASQQATGAKEQASAMNEITTTIRELLATSRQIAESAQRVAEMAEQAASSARSGDTTVAAGHDAMAGIRRQVDLIVSHMLELGKKSQQIGAVLDIVSELAEQTNILAINATIEAAGAGESGKRFAVVADEIRKLADRVAGSTKEIRQLIDDIRSAVNTTVMTTETGSKAVESGGKQFTVIASAFGDITRLVSATTEAAKEIELSTKQQSSAVEQVTVGITNIAQATKETESSSGQTLQTASQLASLSRDLLKLVQPQAA